MRSRVCLCRWSDRCVGSADRAMFIVPIYWVYVLGTQLCGPSVHRHGVYIVRIVHACTPILFCGNDYAEKSLLKCVLCVCALFIWLCRNELDKATNNLIFRSCIFAAQEKIMINKKIYNRIPFNSKKKKIQKYVYLLNLR